MAFKNVLDVVHMTCKQESSAVEDLKPAVESLLCDDVTDGVFACDTEIKKVR